MNNVDYQSIIQKYITNPLTLHIYTVHVTLVTVRALKIAKGIGLTDDQIQFIKEAAMLHDIGIIKVNDEDLGCTGTFEYICHGTEGRKILEAEGFPKHALVAERHTGVGLSIKSIVEQKLPVPRRDMLAETIEEKIISWSDLFYSKDPDSLFREKSVQQTFNSIARYGESQQEIFKEWESMFVQYH